MESKCPGPNCCPEHDQVDIIERQLGRGTKRDSGAWEQLDRLRTRIDERSQKRQRREFDDKLGQLLEIVLENQRLIKIVMDTKQTNIEKKLLLPCLEDDQNPFATTDNSYFH
jgi:hypothetical protein